MLLSTHVHMLDASYSSQDCIQAILYTTTACRS